MSMGILDGKRLLITGAGFGRRLATRSTSDIRPNPVSTT